MHVLATSPPTWLLQVEKFRIQRPCRERDEVIGGGNVIATIKWLNGPAVFMNKFAAKKPVHAGLHLY